MGRKPNPLILEFFVRGAKLEDSSNRYEHTCKSCGEKFPKGRIDSLTAHLVKKCPALSLRDRQKALLQLNDLPELPDGRNNGNAQVALPAAPRNWTALETLAEVSRQIDLSEKHDDRAVANNSAGPQRRLEEPQQDQRFELQEQWTQENPPLSYEARIQREKKPQRAPPQTSSGISELQLGYTGSTMSPSETIAMAAAAQAKFNVPMLDPALIGEGIPQVDSSGTEQALTQYLATCVPDKQSISNWPMLETEGGDSNLQQDDRIPQAQMTTFSAVPPGQCLTTEFSAEFGNGQKSSKPKVRGKFSANRRKEVQEVRKRGACIRCRMLKKPCSGETPCATCKNVESARLWKQPCIRSRMADELDIYSAGLHGVLAYHEVSAVRGRVKFDESPHFVEATHYPTTNIHATFKSLVGMGPQPGQGIDPNLGQDDSDPPDVIHEILDNDDEHQIKMDTYIKRMSPEFYDKEPSSFMKTTLATASKLAQENEDHLLTKVLELWSTVHVLVDNDEPWILTEKPAYESTEQRAVINAETTYQLICMQLHAAIEKIAAFTSKGVLNDLERRLLLRSSHPPFGTFLVAIILLNCVEKSTWLFKSWEQDFLKARWPLDKTPQWYSSQGDKLTDMVQMLLRMRGIPPKTHVQPETGMIVSDDAAAKGWFEQMGLIYSEVVERRDQPVFDLGNPRCYELRFCSKLLLPVSNT